MDSSPGALRARHLTLLHEQLQSGRRQQHVRALLQVKAEPEAEPLPLPLPTRTVLAQALSDHFLHGIDAPWCAPCRAYHRQMHVAGHTRRVIRQKHIR